MAGPVRLKRVIVKARVTRTQRQKDRKIVIGSRLGLRVNSKGGKKFIRKYLAKLRRPAAPSSLKKQAALPPIASNLMGRKPHKRKGREAKRRRQYDAINKRLEGFDHYRGRW